MADEQVQRTRRGPGRPRQEHVTRAVLDAVVDLVAESGMNALTMDAVAARAGVSKPAMYRRWPTKQDLVIAAAESRIGPLTVPDMGDFRAELRAVLTARAEAYRQPGVGRLLAGVIGAAAEAGAEPGAYRAYTSRVMSETRHLLERGWRAVTSGRTWTWTTPRRSWRRPWSSAWSASSGCRTRRSSNRWWT